jgi:pimeloyl-ACP methyl ester carboxylesterase
VVDRRRRAAALALVLLAPLVVLLSGCGGNSTASRLQSRLLSVANLPAGWSGAPTARDEAKPTSTPCLSGLAKADQKLSSSTSGGWTYQTAGFVEGKSIPNLGEALASGSRVRQVWNGFDHTLGACRSATLIVGGTKVRATVRRLAFPRFGATSSAYAWAFTIGGIRIGFDLVLFQTGSYGGSLSYASLGQPPTATVEAFTRAAVAKAQNGFTAPVPGAVSIASAPVQTAHTRLGTVAYREIGTGPPLLLITGYGGTMEDWPPSFVDVLAQHDRVITFDNAGVGKSDQVPGPLTIDAMADQTSALLDTLGLGRTGVLGWSMGSMIAQALAIRHPNQVRRLILCASFPGDGTAVPPSRSELDAFESGNPQKVMAALFPADQTAAENTYLAALSSYPPAPSAPADVVASQKHAIDAWWNGTDSAGKQAAAITIPTLVADGTVDKLDPVTNSHILTKLIRGVKLQLYADAGHAFLFQDQAGFVSLVESFLRGAR